MTEPNSLVAGKARAATKSERSADIENQDNNDDGPSGFQSSEVEGVPLTLPTDESKDMQRVARAEKYGGPSEELLAEPSNVHTKKVLPDLPKVLEHSSGGAATNLEANAGTLKKSNVLRPSFQLPGPLSALKNKTENKVVGLGNYGLGQSFLNKRQNEWLSSTRSVQSHPPSLPLYVTPQARPHQPPAAIITQPMKSQQSDLPTPPMEQRGNEEEPSTPKATSRQPPFQYPPSLHTMASLLPPPSKKKSVEELEDIARSKAIMNPFRLMFLGNISALKVMGYYLLTLETIVTCALTAGLTVYWYNKYRDVDKTVWNGGGLDFVLLAFAVTSPISAAIGMAFQRRERALIAVADFRAFSYHLFLAHCLWDWPEGSQMGRAKAEDENRVDWVEHCDAVLAQLIGIGDELSRFLTLPPASRSRHRMTRAGRKEAARTMEVAYHLLESMTTQRMTRLILYSERLKKIGLPSGEVSRIRQYERFLSDMIEQLRMVKMYRTPQALRSFARIFTVLLPPFYAPSYAQVAKDVDSLGVGIAFGIITGIGLTALFESLQVLEDPFTAFLALDGIDAREEFEVLHYSQLVQTRKLIFPEAPAYPAGRRAALTHLNHPTKLQVIGMPPTQSYHRNAASGYAPSVGSGITFEGGTTTVPAGDDTAPSQFKPPEEVENTHANEELGQTLPLNEVTANRESVFQNERNWLGMDDDGGVRHRRNRTAFSIDTVYDGTSNVGRPTTSNPNSNHTPPQIQTSRTTGGYHRRTDTNNSVASLMHSRSAFRLPDL